MARTCSVVDSRPPSFMKLSCLSETPSRSLTMPRPCRTRLPWKRTRCGRRWPRTRERPPRGSASDRYTIDIYLRHGRRKAARKERGGVVCFLASFFRRTLQPVPRAFFLLFLMLLLFACLMLPLFAPVKRRSYQGTDVSCDGSVSFCDRRDVFLVACTTFSIHGTFIPLSAGQSGPAVT